MANRNYLLKVDGLVQFVDGDGLTIEVLDLALGLAVEDGGLEHDAM